MKRVYVLFFILTTLFVFLQNASAFKEETKCQMLKDAIFMCPDDLKTYLTENFKEVHDGLHFTDRRKPSEKQIKKNAPFFHTNLIQRLKQGQKNDKYTQRSFGLLASFIAENISKDNFFIAGEMLPETVTYDGYQQISDADKRVVELFKKYRKPYKGNSNKTVTDMLYNVAVNEIVDNWVSIWEAAGLQSDDVKPDGFMISHKNMVHQFKGFV